MIMGRRTFDSIGRALPGRDSIVVTHRAADLTASGVYPVADPASALARGRELAAQRGVEDISLIGGAALFEALLPEVDRLHLTIVELEPIADTFFPKLDMTRWREVERRVPPRDPADEADCVFVDFERAG